MAAAHDASTPHLFLGVFTVAQPPQPSSLLSLAYTHTFLPHAHTHSHKCQGNYSEWLNAKDKRLASEAKSQAHLQRLISSELEFLSRQAKGQQAKGRARQRRYDELVSSANAYVRDSQVRMTPQPSTQPLQTDASPPSIKPL